MLKFSPDDPNGAIMAMVSTYVIYIAVMPKLCICDYHDYLITSSILTWLQHEGRHLPHQARLHTGTSWKLIRLPLPTKIPLRWMHLPAQPLPLLLLCHPSLALGAHHNPWTQHSHLARVPQFLDSAMVCTMLSYNIHVCHIFHFLPPHFLCSLTWKRC